MMTIEQGQKRFIIEVGLWSALIFVDVGLVSRLLPEIADPTLQTALRLSPLLPFCMLMAALIRFYRSQDERQREHMRLAASTAMLISVLVFAAYGYLQPFGLPPFSLATALATLAWSYIGASFYLRVRRDGWAKALKVLSLLMFAFGAPAIVYFALHPPTSIMIWIFLGAVLAASYAQIRIWPS